MADGNSFVTRARRSIGGAIDHTRLPGPVMTAPVARPSLANAPVPEIPPLATLPPSPEATWPPRLADGCGRVGLAAALGPEGGRQATLLERAATVPRLERGRAGADGTGWTL